MNRVFCRECTRVVDIPLEHEAGKYFCCQCGRLLWIGNHNTGVYWCDALPNVECVAKPVVVKQPLVASKERHTPMVLTGFVVIATSILLTASISTFLHRGVSIEPAINTLPSSESDEREEVSAKRARLAEAIIELAPNDRSTSEKQGVLYQPPPSPPKRGPLATEKAQAEVHHVPISETRRDSQRWRNDLVTNPTSFAEAYRAGSRAFFAGNYVKAEEPLTWAIKAGTTDPRFYYYRGLIYRRTGRPQEAQTDFREGARLERSGFGEYLQVDQSLEQIQGAEREELEQFRRLK